MAQQHFYSRVPAKVSMFNRADSLDTFACSDGLTEEKINSDLSCVFSNKPTKDEAPLIRDGKIPPVYFHYCDKEGGLIQSCMSFLPVDYTGERTGYLVHSLIVDNDERRTILHSPDNAVLNPELFVHTLDGFDLTSFGSTADDEYPTLPYKTVKSKGAAWLKDAYDGDMLKRLIFAFIGIACGSGKPVYISLCDDIAACSDKTLEFLNSFMQIFPYHIRVRMPFVTYTPDAQKYSAFKIKGILDRDNNNIPTARAIVLNLNQGITLGLKDEAVMEERFLVEFFYELIGNDALRREFLTYTENVYIKMPELYKMNTKALKELVLLFCQCSGLYDEAKILPSENSVHDFLTVYEKYREALSDEFRANSMVCLKRFPKTYTQIPSKTFTKIVKLYSGEPQYSRKIIMGVMLELIHTDANKSKLLQFLRNCYPTETEEIKHQITANLCRVYYGGFMRPQILEFFDGVFEQEPADSRDEIFEKILLTVRTDAIQAQIIAFVDKYYGIFTIEQKEKLFLTFCEALSDGGAFANDFAAVLDKHIVDDEACREDFLKIFLKQIEKEQKRQNRPMFDLVCGGEYKYLYIILCRQVFTEWQGRAILKGFLSQILNGSIEACIANVVTVFDVVGDVSPETQTVMFDGIVERINTLKKKISVVSLMEAEKAVRASFKDNDFGEDLISTAIYPVIEEKLPNILNEENGLEHLSEYIKLHPELNSAPGYSDIKKFCVSEEAIKSGDAKTLFEICAAVNDSAALLRITKLLAPRFKSENNETEIKAKMLVALIPLFIDDEQPDIIDIYNSARSAIAECCDFSGEKDKDFAVNVKALTVFVRIADKAVSAVEGERANAIVLKLKPISKISADFCERFKKPANKWLTEARRSDFAGINSAIADMLIPQKKSFFGIFSK